ncbi:MAG: SAM-dependent methyltransferase [Elusimicrobia bacterium]|nr:SAM-dependent methyltransferase [Elusimicrobiota bacterium]
MTEIEQNDRNEILRRGGITYAEYMNWALYHPRYGYYTSGPVRTGRQGDFFTNVQVGRLFGRLLVETFCEMWDHLGSGRFSLVELGGGDGCLAEQVLLALEEKGRASGVSYYLVEKGPATRESARRRLSRFPRIRIVDDLKSLEHTSGLEGCLFSNEFFDALPFHRVQSKGGALQELHVQEEEGRLVERPCEPSTPRLAGYFSEQGISLAENQKAEVCLLLEETIGEMERVLARGFALSIDYGAPSYDLYRESRSDGTLQVYQKHRRMDDPFEDIGQRDLTALVDFGRLARLGDRGELRPLIFASQGTYFINSAENVLKEVIEKDVGEKKNSSAAAQIQQLVHPEAFGGRFHVLVQGKNVGHPNLSGAKVNRIHRLTTQ